MSPGRMYDLHVQSSSKSIQSLHIVLLRELVILRCNAFNSVSPQGRPRRPCTQARLSRDRKDETLRQDRDPESEKEDVACRH